MCLCKLCIKWVHWKPLSVRLHKVQHISSLCKYALKIPVAFLRETKEGFHETSWMGKGGNPKELMKYSVLHVKSCCRERSGGEGERGDTLQVGIIVKVNLALTQGGTKAQGYRSRKVWWEAGRSGTKPADSYSTHLTRCVITGIKQN